MSTRPSLSRELCIVEIEILCLSVCLSVCKDVFRNPGGIIKLQERLLNEGSGQNMKIIQTFIRMQEIKNIRKHSGKYGSISFFLYTSRR